MTMDWDWQSTLPLNGTANDGKRCLVARTKKEESVIGYMFSADATEKLVTIASQDMDRLQHHGNNLILPCTANSIDIVYKDTYLSSRPSKRICKCWYYPPCNCCIEDAEYEFEESDEENESLPRAYSQVGDVVTRHDVEGPTVWVLGRFRKAAPRSSPL